MKSLKKTCVVFALLFAVIINTAAPVFAASPVQENFDSFCTGINACVVYDMDNNIMVYGKNENQTISVASTTKLLTSLVALSVFNPDDVITVGQEVYLRKPNSSLSLIQPGHQLKVRTLIAALLLPSGNDAAYTVAVNTARKHSGNPSMDYTTAVNYFCSLMMEYARNLGCTNTSFVNPEGWDNTYHYSTASDMTKIAVAAASNAVITSIANIHSNRFYFYSGEWIDWQNTNELLDPESRYYYPYAHGLKTGTTYAAGKCLVAFAEKNGRRLLVLAYGCNTENDRFGKVRDIFEYAFSIPAKGDVDGSGDISSADSRIVLRISVGLDEATEAIRAMGDIDNNGLLSAGDARSILRAAVGLEDPSQW